MRTRTLIFLCLIAWPARALDVTVGTMTNCSAWLQERDKLKIWTQFRDDPHGPMPTGTHSGGAYLIGFIEGYDFACPAEKPRWSGLDTEAVLERADAICKSKGGDTLLLSVALDLVKQLDPQHSGVCRH